MNETAALTARWAALGRELGWSDNAAPIATSLLSCYGEAHRRYHGVAHLTAVLTVLDELSDPSDGPAASSRLAAWFHDAVYDPRAADNEERSAALARRWLAPLGVDDTLLVEIEAMVLATKTHRPDGLAHAAVLLDADLAVLGAEPKHYERYCRGVRFEYRHLDDATFRAGRRAVLTQFLQRPHLFHTEAGRHRFEAAARRNLAAELLALEEG